jgi:hypothetical protein
MGSLEFRCPSTGEVITSGIHTDSGSLELVRGLPVKLYCPRCRTVHVMTAEDGRLGDGETDTAREPHSSVG